MSFQKIKHKGFTLIELLIVIAIIGILSSIVFVNLSNARLRARDAAIISSANTMMKLALADTVSGTTSYSAYTGFAMTTDICATYYGSTVNPAGMRAACSSIISHNTGMGCGDAACLWSSTWGGNFLRYSLIVWLPGRQRYYCVGSNGGASMTTSSTGTGCGGSWNCPGCAGQTE